MPHTLILNFSSITKLEKHNNKVDLIDLRYTIVNVKNQIHNLIDLEVEIPISLQLYQEFVGEMLKDKDLLNIKVNSFSIYWLTNCSIKGYAWHWGRDFFLLLQILRNTQQKIEKNYKELIIYIPKKWSFLKETINSLIVDSGYQIKTVVELIDEGTKPVYLWKLFFQINKSWLVNSLNLFQLSSTERILSKNIYLRYKSKSKSKSELFHATQLLFESNNNRIDSLPFFWYTKPEIPKDLIEERPKITELLSILAQIYLAIYKSVRLPKRELKVSKNIVINRQFITLELLETLKSQMHLFFFYKWLRNYLGSVSGDLRLFYDDEFYDTGRVISHAASIFPKISTYGLQHGHIMEAHTVYMITDDEVKAGLPKPDHFIVWGDYYARIFGLNNSLLNDYTLKLGNPIYILNQSIKEGSTELKKVLWCLTTKECMQVEWGIIKDVLIANNLKLTIRLHPIPHINESEVRDLIGSNYGFLFSKEKSIINAINKTDLVLVSAHSTTFLDSYVCKKKCIRLVSRFWDGNQKIKASLLKTAATDEAFKEAFKGFSQGIQSASLIESDVELSNIHWAAFFA